MDLRLFVAVEPPTAVRDALAALQADLKRRAGRAAADVRWVAPENVHLTLQFLGAVPEERLAEIEAAVAAAAATARPLALELRGVGAFPAPRRPRVVWAGVAGDLEPLTGLVAELGRRLAPLGYPPEERRFSPHLTLGRAREPRGAPRIASALDGAGGGPGTPWAAAELTLFRSHLSPQGARYEPLTRAALGKAE